MENENTQTTLRDTISDAFDEVVTKEPIETVAAPVTTEETAEQKADRIRDEKGRFAQGATDKPVTPNKVAKTQVPPVAAPVVESKPRPPRPSSWKKDYWEQWDKLDPTLADYLHQREQEYARGVSTYRNEWEQAKPLVEAMAQFQPILKQYNIPPGKWISDLGNAHKELVLGSPEKKIDIFRRLAQDYQVPLQALLGQDQGQPNQLQYINPLYERISQLEGQLNNWNSLNEKKEQDSINRELENFSKDKEHFEVVRVTMAGLLQSGLAENLDDAYAAAIRLPKHADIFEAQQQQLRRQDEAKKAEEAKKRVVTAKANAVSPRTTTPSGVQANSNGKKGLRDQLSEAFDEVTASRV